MRPNGHQALFAPLTEDPHQPFAAVDGAGVERQRLAHAQACAVEQLNQRYVAAFKRLRLGLRRPQQLQDLLHRQEARQPLVLFRGAQPVSRVYGQQPLPAHPGEMSSQGGELTGDGGWLVAVVE